MAKARQAGLNSPSGHMWAPGLSLPPSALALSDGPDPVPTMTVTLFPFYSQAATPWMLFHIPVLLKENQY